jgi:hypothetical protein
MDHVTAVLEVPPTVAVNCVGETDAFKVALAGATEMVTTGTNVTAAVAVLVESAALVALTVTVCGEMMVAGTL